ncbi:MAG: hypothetical protein K2F94_04215 [Muribaculaceae bacterium]|nr:hypothetical protein [Muribaculaceae bacterium]MDE6532375.1 hypothetical protein [Muribaculaceae bacterium]MDE6772239.1 hypothetical protein [Muribaculaceae bacterium]
MHFKNCDNIDIVDSFIRIFGGMLADIAPHYDGVIEFRLLTDRDNDCQDIMGRIGNVVYFSEEEVSRIGLSDVEILASLAHEVGHIVYNTRNWDIDCEHRADMLAAEIGLGSQMISAIDKILKSRRYNKLTSKLIGRIHFLQNHMRG